MDQVFHKSYILEIEIKYHVLKNTSFCQLFHPVAVPNNASVVGVTAPENLS